MIVSSASLNLRESHWNRFTNKSSIIQEFIKLVTANRFIDKNNGIGCISILSAFLKDCKAQHKQCRELMKFHIFLQWRCQIGNVRMDP